MTFSLYNRSLHGDIYNQALSSAYIQGIRIYDPDYALLQDADIYAKVRRDAVINHAIEMRLHLIGGRSWTIEPAGDTDQDKLAAKIIEDIVKHIFMMPSALFNLSQAVIRGSAYAFIEGVRKNIQVAGMPEENWWVPLKLKDIGRERFRQMVDPNLNSKGQVVIKWQVWNIVKREWINLDRPELFVRHVYEDTEARLGYGRGLLESIYYYHYAKTVVLSEGLRGVERWAQGLIHIAIDGAKEASTGKPNKELIKEWLSQMNKQRSSNIIVHDKNDDIEMLDGPKQGSQIVNDMLQYLDNGIIQLLLGSVSPTSGSSATLISSPGSDSVQEASREALISFDRALLEETLTRDLIGLIWRLNRPLLLAKDLADANKPLFSIFKGQKDDYKTSAGVVSTLLMAGIDLKSDEVYRKTGFTPPQEGDDIIKGEEKELLIDKRDGDRGALDDKKSRKENREPTKEVIDDVRQPTSTSN